MLIVHCDNKAFATAFNKYIAISVDESNWPYAFQLGSHFDGVYPTLAREAFRRMNVTVLLKSYPFKRLELLLGRGEITVLGLYRNSQREKIYYFSQPYFFNETVLFADQKIASGIIDLNSLTGLKIGLGRGFTYGKKFDKLRDNGVFETVETSSALVGLQMVAHEQIDGFATTLMAGKAIIAIHPERQDVVPFACILAKNGLHLAFNKNSEKTDFLKAFDLAMNAMVKDGTYDTILTMKYPNPATYSNNELSILHTPDSDVR